MQKIEDQSILIQYELKDSSAHVMDARVEAESSLQCIKAINYVSRVLDIPNNLQTGSLEKGSVCKIFHFDVKGGEDSKFLRYILTILFRKIFFERKEVVLDDITEELDGSERASVESILIKRGIDIERLNRLNTHQYLKKARSDYFKQIVSYKGIKAIGIKHNKFEKLNEVDLRILSPDFQKFIELIRPEVKIHDDARVYIVSPVIVKGKEIKWSGNYDSKDIKFDMLSSQFKAKAQNAEIDFRTGFYINCRLQYNETFNEKEETVQDGYKVLEVYGHGYNDNYVETRAGKKKRLESNQMSLFGDLDK